MPWPFLRIALLLLHLDSTTATAQWLDAWITGDALLLLDPFEDHRKCTTTATASWYSAIWVSWYTASWYSALVLCQQSGWTHPGGSKSIAGVVVFGFYWILLLLMQAGCRLEVWNLHWFLVVYQNTKLMEYYGLLSRMNCKFVIFDLSIELLSL